MQQTKTEAVQRLAARTVNNIPGTDHTTNTAKLIVDLEWHTMTTRREIRRHACQANHVREVATDIAELITQGMTISI